MIYDDEMISESEPNYVYETITSRINDASRFQDELIIIDCRYMVVS